MAMESQSEAAAPLSVNDRLEVLWQVEEDGKDTLSRWWGCKVLEKEGKDDSGVETLRVLYDAFDCFEPSEARLRVLGDHYVEDIELGEGLPFRREGDSWDDVADLEEGDDDGDMVVDLVDSLDKNAVHTMQELADMQNQLDPSNELQEGGLKEMAKMPFEKQQRFAHDFVQFRDFLSAQLRTLVDTKGQGYEVCKGDMDRILAEFQSHVQKAS